MNKKIISMFAALAAAMAAVSAQAAAGSLGVNAQNALNELQGGMNGASLEESSQGGFKAEQALMGLAQKGESSLVDASGIGARATEAAGQTAEARRFSLTVADVPAPGAKPAPEKPGFFERVKNKALDIALNAKAHYDKWGKAKLIAFLGAILAAEVATLIWPTTAITVVFMGIGALGIIGTTRELIAAIRRGDQ